MNTTQTTKIKVTQKEFDEIKESLSEKCREIRHSANEEYNKIVDSAEEIRYKKLDLAWEEQDKSIAKYEVVEN